MVEVRCSNCGTSFVIGNGSVPTTELKDGIHYLVPQTIRNENKLNTRLETLKAAGVNIDKLKSLMQDNDSIKDIFDDNDPIIKELSNGGFIRNKELFRRFITAQTFRLLKDPKGWTHAVRNKYNIFYAFRQTKKELELLCKLKNKNPNDKRFNFFTLSDMKKIFTDFVNACRNANRDRIDTIKVSIKNSTSYQMLLYVINSDKKVWNLCKRTALPMTWINCFKGAGAYYTLQNIIQTHGLILPKCTNMNESLEELDKLFKEIIRYPSSQRRWDLMLSLLTTSVKVRNFELKW